MPLQEYGQNFNILIDTEATNNYIGTKCNIGNMYCKSKKYTCLSNN